MRFLDFLTQLRDYFRQKGHQQPKLSLLIPFQSDNRERRKAFSWLLKYWRHELPDAEIIIGHSHGRPFSKTVALNDAVERATGKVLVILDADAYIEGSIIEKCADRILEELEEEHHLWYVPYRHLYRLTEEASEEVLESDPANPLRLPVPPPASWLDGDIMKNTYGHRYGAMLMILPREAFDVLGCFDERFCVDEETEILTKEGWKTYDNLQIGDIALTLNHETGMSEWQPVQSINVFDNKGRKMLSMESKNHSSLTTPEHNWPVVKRPDYRPGTGWGSPESRREWATSATFKDSQSVPISAFCGDLPDEPTYSDEIVESVAWFWTEGSISRLRSGGFGNNISLTQSLNVNPDNCERIRETLTVGVGPSSSSFPRRGKSVVPDVPRWRENTTERPGIMKIYFNAEAGKLLQELAPNRVPSYEFLMSLTKKQLDLFIEVSLLADRTEEKELTQKNLEASESFQFACILAGYGTSLRMRSMSTDKKEKYGYDMANVRMRSAKTFRPFRNNRKWVNYDGKVWCPTTPNATWLARRNGSVYFTGNSGWGGEDVSFLRAVDTLWGKHKTTNNAIFHLWHPTQGKTYRSRAWKGQRFLHPNDHLATKYHKATRHPAEMRALVDAGCAAKRRPLHKKVRDWSKGRNHRRDRDDIL